MKEAEGIISHLDAACKNDLVIDVQDLLLRSTLTSFAQLAMGIDIHALDVEHSVVMSADAQGNPQRKYQLPTVEFMKAFDMANEVAFFLYFSAQEISRACL